MSPPNVRAWPLVVLMVVASLLVPPAGVKAQCTAFDSTSMMGANYTILRFLTTTTTCTLTFDNAMFCTPTGPVATSALLAVATTASAATMMGSTMGGVACGWNCGCGQMTIDGGDGLPVELLDFSIEVEEPTSDAHASDEGTDDPDSGESGDDSGFLRER